MTDTHITAPTRFVEVDGDRFAYRRWGNLATDQPPTFILNGTNDVMISTINSWYLAQNIPNAQLFIYPDPGHARGTD